MLGRTVSCAVPAGTERRTRRVITRTATWPQASLPPRFSSCYCLLRLLRDTCGLRATQIIRGSKYSRPQQWVASHRTGWQLPAMQMGTRASLPTWLLRNLLWGWKWIGVYAALFSVVAALWAAIGLFRPDISPLAAPLLVIWLWLASITLVAGSVLGLLRPLTRVWPGRIVVSVAVASIFLYSGVFRIFKWWKPTPDGPQAVLSLLCFGVIGAWVFAPRSEQRR